MTEPTAVSLRCQVEKKGKIDLQRRGALDEHGLSPTQHRLVETTDDVSLDCRTVWDEDEVEGVAVEMRAYHVPGVDDQHYHLGLEMWVSWRDVEALHAALGAMLAGRKAGAFA